MARKRISEFRAKTLLYHEFGLQYEGVQINEKKPLPDNLETSKHYVIKVDQGIKGRFKKGLVLLNQPAEQIPNAIKLLQEKGYSQFLIEEDIPHDSQEEKYISIERTRDGYKVLYSNQGGIHIEQQNSIRELLIPYGTNNKTTEQFNNENINTKAIDQKLLSNLIKTFDKYYFSFLEINPYLILNTNYLLLDAAAEVDSTAAFFVNNAWTEADFTDNSLRQKTEEEKNVQKLAENSQAAFSLEVLNPHGSIFMMLSGGGASIVLADEVHNQGYGKELANYGEYSGNPNAEETYIYAKNLLSLLLKSAAKKKVLIIAGGVANFTDVRITFKGLIKALDEIKIPLREQGIKVFVRRGGPYQEEGLANMETFLKKEQLLGTVSGPTMVLTEVVTMAIKNIN
jgi:ATP-citrate lyase beta-subunit